MKNISCTRNLEVLFLYYLAGQEGKPNSKVNDVYWNFNLSNNDKWYTNILVSEKTLQIHCKISNLCYYVINWQNMVSTLMIGN